MEYLKYTDGTVSEVTVEEKKHDSVISNYSYNEMVTKFKCQQGNILGNDFIRWQAPIQTINFTKSEYISYVDTVFLNASQASYLVNEDDTLRFIDKMKLKDFRIVIEEYFCVSKSYASSESISHLLFSEIDEENEYIIGVRFRFENIVLNKHFSYTNIQPYLRFVNEVTGNTLYLMHPLLTNISKNYYNPRTGEQSFNNSYGKDNLDGVNYQVYYNMYDLNNQFNYPPLGANYFLDTNNDVISYWRNVSNTSAYIKYGTTKEGFLKALALLGVYFRIDDKDYLGFMDESGQTTGEYLEEVDWSKSVQENSETINNFIEHKDPYVPPDDDDKLAQQTMSTSRQDAKFLKYYLLSDSDVENLASDINSSFLSNPLQYLISLTEISPLLNNFIETFAVEEQIKIGTWEASTTTGLRIRRSDGLILVGYTQVNRVFNNFLDFDPYTKMMLYVPFCGTCEIPVDTAMGKLLSVFLNFDFENLNCIAMVYVDGALITCLSGNLGKEISTKDTNKLLKGINIGASVLSAGAIAVNGVTNNPMALFALPSAVGGVVNSMQSNCSIVKLGTGDYTNFITPTRCCLFRTMPRVNDLTGYRKSVGIRCEKYGKLKDFHGFTVCRNPHINVSATEEEKEMLYEILSNGVILP